VVHSYKDKKIWKERGVVEYTVSTPLKPSLLATIKSNNYLLNALTAMESEERGGMLGVVVDDDGVVAEGSINNVAIVDKEDVIKTPPFTRILAGTTIKRVFDLAPKLVEKGGWVGWWWSNDDVRRRGL